MLELRGWLKRWSLELSWQYFSCLVGWSNESCIEMIPMQINVPGCHQIHKTLVVDAQLEGGREALPLPCIKKMMVDLIFLILQLVCIENWYFYKRKSFQSLKLQHVYSFQDCFSLHPWVSTDEGILSKLEEEPFTLFVCITSIKLWDHLWPWGTRMQLLKATKVKGIVYGVRVEIAWKTAYERQWTVRLCAGVEMQQVSYNLTLLIACMMICMLWWLRPLEYQIIYIYIYICMACGT